MGELNYPQGNHEWASEKGVERKCRKHGIKYDPLIGCTECLREQREEKKRRLKEAFDNVVWPDK